MDDTPKDRRRARARSPRFGFRVLIPILLSLLALTGCIKPASPTASATSMGRVVDPCTAEPLEPFDSYEVGVSYAPSTRFSGQVGEIQLADEFGRMHYLIRDAAGAEHRLACKIPGQTLPVETGRPYVFELERVGGSPTAASLVIRDSSGLVFAGVSDQGIGDHVLKNGIPGFQFALSTTNCTNRPHNECLESIVNLALRITSADQSAVLHHPESARLGDYEVRCLIAQRAKYSGRCPDFALVGVSYTITRVK